MTNWFEAPDLAAEKAAIGRLNKAAIDNVIYVPTGFFLATRPGGRMSPAWSRRRSLLLGRVEVLIGKKVARCSPI